MPSRWISAHDLFKSLEEEAAEWQFERDFGHQSASLTTTTSMDLHAIQEMAARADFDDPSV